MRSWQTGADGPERGRRRACAWSDPAPARAPAESPGRWARADPWHSTLRMTCTPRLTGWEASASACEARKLPWVRMPARCSGFSVDLLQAVAGDAVGRRRAWPGGRRRTTCGEENRSSSLPLACGPEQERARQRGGLVQHRLRRLGRVAGEGRVLLQLGEALDVQPLQVEVADAVLGPLVLQHAPRPPGRCGSGRLQLAVLGGGEQVVVGHRRPQEVRQPRGDLPAVRTCRAGRP